LSGIDAGATPEAAPSGVCVLGWKKWLRGWHPPFFIGHIAAHVSEPISDIHRQREPPPSVWHREQWNGHLTTTPRLSQRRRSSVTQRRYQRFSTKQRAVQAQHGFTHLLLQRRGIVWVEHGLIQDLVFKSRSVRDSPAFCHPHR